MRNLIIVTAAVAMAAMPSLADAQGRGHGRGHGPAAAGHRGAACPPGLANRNPPCMPPGQARHLYRIGQRLPSDVTGLLGYGALPLDLRQRYAIPSGYRYLYRDDALYVVDPRTQLVRSVIDVLAR